MMSHVMTLANSIIGVSVLAMPFCFKQCGIVLAIVVLLLSSVLSRLACHFLIKSAVMSRRRNFEFLAFHAFGRMGKFLVELFIVGFLIGTCIAFFVVVGDLGPQIVGKIINKNPEDIRTSLLVTTGVFIILPLGLLRNIDSLTSVSTAAIAFYICLVLKVVAESTHQIFTGEWFTKVYYWRPSGILQCLPIFSMALFCQTQLFEIYDSIPNVSLEKMNDVVRGSLNICTLVYLCTGLFGYIAFCAQPFTGNILMSFEPTLTSEVIKMGFVISVAFSFPLVIFPCRASLNSFLFRRAYSHESSNNYIPETRFRCLTISILLISLITGILIPNIEFVLGIVGSTIGVMICVIFPAAFFISISTKNTNERLLAQIMLFVGVWIMVLGTYANLYAMEEASNVRGATIMSKFPSQINNLPQNLNEDKLIEIPEVSKSPENILSAKEEFEKPESLDPDKPPDTNVRQEPPIPVERIGIPDIPIDKPKPVGSVVLPNSEEAIDKAKIKVNANVKSEDMNYISGNDTKKINSVLNTDKKLIVEESNNKNLEIEKINEISKNDVINSDAIKKEDSELAAESDLTKDRREALLRTLEEHKKKQLQLMQEQKEILKDIKKHKKELEADKKELLTKNIQINAKDDEKQMHDMESDLKKDKEIKAESKVIVKESPSDIQSQISTDEASSKIAESKRFDEKVDKPSPEIKSVQNNAFNVASNDINKEKVLSDSNVLVNKSQERMLNVLTKNQSKTNPMNAIPNGQMKNITNGDDLEKKRKLDIPIALKMNDQTKLKKNKDDPPVNQTNNENSVIRRDILENHERDKRNIDDKIEDSKSRNNDTVIHCRENSLNSKVNEIKKEENCPEQSEKLSNEKVNDVQTHIENEGNFEKSKSESLIKTPSYLSQQEFTEVLIDSNLMSGGEFVKVKKRDLKSLKFQDDNMN